MKNTYKICGGPKHKIGGTLTMLFIESDLKLFTGALENFEKGF